MLEQFTMLAGLAVAVFGAYRVNDYLADRGYGADFRGIACLGWVLAIVLSVMAAIHGFGAIVSDLHLIGSVALIAGMAVLGYRWRGGYAGWIGAILAFAVSVWVAVEFEIDLSSPCRTDWDGRSNPTVCD